MGNDEKARNKIDETAGKAKEALGKATGNESTENEGKADQSKADLRQAAEKAKDAFRH